MNSNTLSVCIRCGKPRIRISETKELIGNSLVTTVVAECADPDCQKKVEEMFAKESALRKISAKEKEVRDKTRMLLAKANRASRSN